MMVSYVCLYLSSKLRNCACKVSTTDRMGLHQHPFFRGKSTSFPQKGRKVFMDLANVMKERCGPDSIDLLGVQAEFPSDLTGVLRNAHRMTRCVRVSGFNGLYHQFEKFSVHPFDLEIHLVHVTDKEQR